jgi:hypothetical protein
MQIKLRTENAVLDQALNAQAGIAKARARLEALNQYLQRCLISGTLHPLNAEIQSALTYVLDHLGPHERGQAIEKS